jgi:hypothetical protein
VGDGLLHLKSFGILIGEHMQELLLGLLTYALAVFWYGLCAWSCGSGAYWLYRDKKSQPLSQRINRLSYEIDNIEGVDCKQTPESLALRKARDIDKLELMEYEDDTESVLRTWGSWRLIKNDPYSPTNRWRVSKKSELRRNLGMET